MGGGVLGGGGGGGGGDHEPPPLPPTLRRQFPAVDNGTSCVQQMLILLRWLPISPWQSQGKDSEQKRVHQVRLVISRRKHVKRDRGL